MKTRFWFLGLTGILLTGLLSAQPSESYDQGGGEDSGAEVSSGEGQGQGGQGGGRRRGGGGGGGGGNWQGRAGGGGGGGGMERQIFGGMSQEERAVWRERVRSMSQEERAAWMNRFRNMSPEERERLRNGTPEERMQWFQQNQGQVGSGQGVPGGGGRRFRGGRGGGMSRAVDVPEQYRPLVENSPFMSPEYRASLENNGASGRREVQFTGLSRPNGGWLFGLEERRMNRTYWLAEGGNENGIEIRGFDETHKTLTVSIDGMEVILRIANQ